MSLIRCFGGMLAAVVVLVCAQVARGSCPPAFTTDFPGTDVPNTVNAMAIYDDGTGPALFVAGSFTSAGGVTANRVAKYDGRRWFALGNGLNSTVNALTVFNSELYAAGTFSASGTGAGSITLNRVARWNGTQWRSVGVGTENGVNSTVNAIAVYSGELCVAGNFSAAGTVAVANIAKWNGTAWSQPGAGLNAEVKALGVFTDGGVSKLFAGGLFTASGAVTNMRGVARWNGTTWAVAGQGFTGTAVSVNAFTFFSGSIYAGGAFTGSGINSVSNVARWTGSQWVDVGGGVSATSNAFVNALASFNDGGGEALFVGGNFTTAAGGTVSSPRVVKWDGTNWQSMSGASQTVMAFQPFNDGHGNALFISGQFTSVGANSEIPAQHIAKWANGAISAGGRGTSGTINAMTAFGTPNPDLIIAGDVVRAGDALVSGVARFNGTSWAPLGTGVFNSPVLETKVFNGELYAAGGFTLYDATQMRRIAKWTGTTWQEVTGANAINSTINTIAVHNNELYVGGGFSAPIGRVARWTGTTFVALATGLNNTVNRLVSYGGRLVAAGTFTQTGAAVPVNRIAQWNGTDWLAMGNGVNNAVKSMAVLGNELFVAGDFTTAGTGSASRVARWNGTTWSDAGGGMDGSVEDLVVLNDGGAQTLFAVGAFVNASGSTANRVAFWNGCRWVNVGSGVEPDANTASPTVTRVGAVNSGPAKGAYIAGVYTSTDGLPAQNFSRIVSCAVNCPADFDDGSGTGHPDGGVTIDDLLYYIGIFEAGDINADLDNGSGTGQCDGGTTIDDLLYFITRFELGC